MGHMSVPGRREPLTRERIVDAAAVIVDERGLEALSMRTVAGSLGAGTMSLYRYVADRDELLDLVLAQMTAAIALPGPTGRWREDLAGVARALRAALVARPGLTALLTSRGGRGRAGLVLLDAAVAVLRAAEFEPREAVLAGATLGGFVAGSVLREVAGGVAAREAGSNATARGIDIAGGPGLEQAAWAGPALISTSSNELFEVGLRIVLDGIESVLGPGRGAATR